MIPYENCKVYGPYQSREDKRFRVVVVFTNKIKVTVSYPKYLMELHLGRYLRANETVDHKDNDVTNNVIDNFQILTRISHIQLDALRLKPMVINCQICKEDFELSGVRLSDAIQNKIKGTRGPFCSKSCAGKATNIMNNLENVLKPVEYYTNKEI